MKELINQFLEYLEKKELNPQTVRNYDFYLRRFFKWFDRQKIKNMAELNEKDVKRYKTWLKRIKNPVKKIYLSEQTQLYHLIALRAFLRFLEKSRIKALNYKKVKLFENNNKNIEFLLKSEIQRLLDSPTKVKQDKILTARDKALLELISQTGLKVSQIALLKIKDVDLKQKKLKLKNKVVDLDNQTSYWLKKYIKTRKNNSEPLFIRHDRAAGTEKFSPLSPRSMERIVLRYGRAAGLEKRITPRILRNSYLISFVKNSNVSKFKKHFDYKSNTTFQRYKNLH
ncbi:MAG TPA: tyrosine-type recombinase/integrase [Patescibacteria group bacterium]|nr:tyrosine-type recombinase/integrase [Patescibacteria group bacterium]